MDARQTPAETDIAKMLDSVATCRDGGYPETLHVLRWLIERAPPARALHDRLHAPRDDRPSLIELARLLIAVETGERYPESVYTAHWLIERSPAAAKRLARLKRMAADAGLDDGEPDWAVSALKVRAATAGGVARQAGASGGARAATACPSRSPRAARRMAA